MVILCTIDLETREVSLPAGQVIASYDHNVDVIRFQAEAIPGFSLNTSSIKIAAQGPNKSRHDYAVDPSTVQIEEETGYITFDWPIPQGVTEMPIGSGFKYGDRGQLIFAVCAEIISGDTVSKAWHSDDGIITVVAHLEPEAGGGEDPSEEATNAQKIGQLQTDVAVVQREVSAVAGGTPTVVDAKADMTEHDKIYILSSDGKWYYYSATAEDWVIGGTYGGVPTDTTLSISGSAADAKAVGDALATKADSSDVTALGTRVTTVEGDVDETKADLSAEIDASSIEYNPFTKGMWRVGSISPTTGANATDSASISLATGRYIYPQNGVTYLLANTGYKFYVFAYDVNDNTYVGSWDGNGFSKSWSTYKTETVFYTAKYKGLYNLKVALIRNDSADMTTDEYTNLRVFYSKWTESDGIRTKLYRDNLADDTTKVKGYLNATGGISAPTETSSRETTTDYIPVEPNTIYRITVYVEENTSFWFRVCVYDAEKAFISKQDDVATIPYIDDWRNFKAKTFLWAMPSNGAFIRVSVRHGFCSVTQGVTEWDYNVSPVDIRRHWSLRPKQDYFVKTVNHRGYGRIAPENTAPAFELSADLGFWGVENDIRFTSDGVAVLLHDETINRTGRNADGSAILSTINIADITYEQALTYDFGIWMGEQYAGTKIMTFEEFVALCRKKSLHMYNEIKAGTQAQVNALVNIVKRYGMQKHCTWISFSSTYLGYVTTIEQKSRVGLIVSSVTSDTITTLNALKTGENDVFVDVNGDNTPTESIIEQLISNDIELEMYTLNFVSGINNADHYVTGITSDWCIAGDVLYNDVNNIMVFDA